MSERIERKDLISDEALQAIVELANKLEIAQTNLKELINQARALNKQMTAATGIKEMNKQTVEAAKLQNKLNIESAKYANDLKKLEVAAQRTALAAEKAALAQNKHNETLKKSKENTNTWSKALSSFQFKFNFLGNAAAMLSGGLLKIGASIGNVVVKAFTSWFTKTDEGMELMERKVAGAKAAWNVLSAEIGKAGQKMGEAFEEPQKRAGKFYTTILAGIGSIWGANTMGKMMAIGQAMDQASMEAEKFTKALQDQEDEEIAQISVRAKMNLEIAKARQLSMDETKTINQRVDALNNALAKEDELLAQEVSNNEVRISALEDMKVTYKQFWTDDMEKTLQEALAKRYNLETESIGRTRRAESTLAKFRKELEEGITDKQNEEMKKRNAAIIEWNEFKLRLAENVLKEEKKFNEEFFNDMDSLLEDLSESASDEYDAVSIILKKTAELYQKENDDQLKRTEEQNEFKKASVLALLEFSSGILDYYSAKDKSRMDAELKAVGDNEEKQEKIKKKYAIKEQNRAALQALINGAMAITNLIATTPGSVLNPATYVGIALAGVMTAIQIATIKAQKFAKGTDSSPEGLAWVGEKGRELMIDKRGNVGFSPDKAALTYLEKGTKIIPADITARMMMDSKRRPRERERNEMIPYLAKIADKPVTSVNIDNTGISVMTETSNTLTRRIDKYFRS